MQFSWSSSGVVSSEVQRRIAHPLRLGHVEAEAQNIRTTTQKNPESPSQDGVSKGATNVYPFYSSSVRFLK